MDWIELESERLQAARVQEDKAREWCLYAATVVSRDAGSLWKSLIRQVEADVEKMRKTLGVDWLECGPIGGNNNTLEVRSKVQPVVKLRIVYKLLDRVITQRTELRGFSKCVEHPEEEFRFEVDSNGAIYFAGNDGRTSIPDLSQHLLTPVLRFFSST
jgi:hypothetical protein